MGARDIAQTLTVKPVGWSAFYAKTGAVRLFRTRVLRPIGYFVVEGIREGYSSARHKYAKKSFLRAYDHAEEGHESEQIQLTKTYLMNEIGMSDSELREIMREIKTEMEGEISLTVAS